VSATNFTNINKSVFKILRLQEMITHRQTDIQTYTTEFISSHRCTAGDWSQQSSIEL